MKKAITALLAFFVFLTVNSQSITTTAATISSCPGIVTIPIYVTNFNDVASISLNLIYDSTLINYLGYKNANPDLINTGTLLTNGIPGKVFISWFSLTPLNIGSASLIELEFEYFTDNASLKWDTVTFGNCQYSNSNLDVIPALFIDGGVYSSLTSPVLIYPSNQSDSVPTNDKFTWKSSQCSPAYRIQIARDSVFSDIVIAATGISDTFYDVNNLQCNTTYFWRVNASLAMQTTNWSDTAKFFTKGPPGMFEYNTESDFRLSVSPNPLYDKASITFDLPRPGKVSVFIYDISGKLVYNKTGNQFNNKGINDITVDFSSYDSGLYFIELVISMKQRIFTQKTKIAIIRH